MEISDILSKLGLDLSNPDAKRGALEAIDAILASRESIGGGDLGNGSDGSKETEVELDPDLLQPSIKQAPVGSDDDIEIEDEEKILDQIKHKESEDPIENNSNSSDSDSESDKEPESQSNDSQSDNSDLKDTTEGEEEDKENQDSYDNTESDGDEESNSEIENSDDLDGEDFGDSEDGDSGFDGDGPEEDDDDLDFDPEGDIGEFGDEEDGYDEDSEDEDEEEFDFDEDDLIDNDLKDTTEDEEIKTKNDARIRKRERTIAAAKKALEDAQAKKVSPALIRELEKSIEALEALTEAVAKSIKDVSDEEFNMLINRVLDAIEACGDSGLTYSSQEDREAKVQEIKADLAKAETQNELSAEDVAKIRAETQSIRAREKEVDKYKQKSASSFKGFQEFLNSLYKAIALQVGNEENKDDSWSAINRRYGGTGILQPGKKIQELPDKRIPIIDFYFDQSGSWDEDDIKVGEKAVQSLADMEADGKIKINVYYFANNVFSDAASARAQGGTCAWNDIVKNIISTQATNVIIMTDWDMENYWIPSSKPPLKYTVPGYVWYLWKNGSNAPRLPRDLKGRGGVQQFAFSANDL